MKLDKAIEILEEQKLFTPLGQACHRVLSELERLQYYNKVNVIRGIDFGKDFGKEPKFSKRLQEALNSRNMKQTELAEKTGITKGAISQYLTGAYKPKYINIYKIASVLKVNPDWLMGRSGYQEADQ